MSDHATVYVSGGLLTPGILNEAVTGGARGEFAPGSFRRLDGTPVDDLDDALEDGFTQLCALYDELADELPMLDRSALRERWVLPLLSALDWRPSYQRQHLRPTTIDDATFSVSHRGWDDPSAPPVHIEPSHDDELRLDARPAPRSRSPHDELQQYLNLADELWGIVTDGRELRLLRDFHHTTTKGFVGVDLEALFTERDFEGWQALYRLAHVSRFLPTQSGDPSSAPLEQLYQRSRAAGITVGKALHPRIREAIEYLANGILRQDPSVRELVADAQRARDFYAEVLRVVYRLLFLLFAEQRGMLPGSNSLYADTYSVTRLRELADRARDVEPRRTDLYEGLKVTFRLMSQGSEALGITAFNGQLFDETATPTMTAGTIANRDLIRAIRAMTSIVVDGHREHVAFATIGVEELGSVYERLLDYTPRIATAPTEVEDGATVPTGSLYLERIGDRELGSYYTPPDLVDLTLERSLDRLLDERLEAAGSRADEEAALLDIRAVDPACGSGGFLIAVIDRIAERLADVRLDGAQPTERQLAEARRDVLQNCIYGVDVDAFAAELCKVALWIHCAVSDLPLNFLDHRIQCGNSLIGWPMKGLPEEIPLAAYKTKSQTEGTQRTKEICADARARNRAALEGQLDLFAKDVPRPDVKLDYPALWSEEEKSPADVEKKAQAYDEYRASIPYRAWTAAADVWVSSFFWNEEVGEVAPTSLDYWRALRTALETRDSQMTELNVERTFAESIVAGAGELSRSMNAFHWPLRFPEIAERGGFDVVVGNPPWEQFESREKEWFEVRAPHITALTGSRRKEAIAELAVTQPALAREWAIFSTTNARMSDFAKKSQRFSDSGGKVNTYLLFTDLNAQLVGPEGISGFLVKSGLGIDEGGTAVFRPLVERGQVRSFIDIVNGGRRQHVIFEGVAEVERFAAVCLGGARDDTHFTASMMNWSIDEAREREPIDVDRDVLATFSPVTFSLPSFREPSTWQLGKRLQETHSILDFDEPTQDELASGVRARPQNPWDLRYATLFNSTTASRKFERREDLEAEDWRIGTDMVFRRGDQTALPLYEGQLMNRYNHRARTYEGYPTEKKYGRKPGIPLTGLEQLANPDYEIEPRYWMLASTAEERLEATIGDRVLLAFRDVGAVWTNQRSARAALIPRYPATDKLPVLGLRAELAFEFLALWNGTVFDFLVRGKMPGSGVKLVWMLSQLPMPAPGCDSRLAENARQLSLTSHSVARVFDTDPYPWDEEERYRLDVETDALVAHAYGVTEREYGVILDTFEVLARKELAEHGRYRFKHDCLSAYRRLG